MQRPRVPVRVLFLVALLVLSNGSTAAASGPADAPEDWEAHDIEDGRIAITELFVLVLFAAAGWAWWRRNQRTG